MKFYGVFTMVFCFHSYAGHVFGIRNLYAKDLNKMGVLNEIIAPCLAPTENVKLKRRFTLNHNYILTSKKKYTLFNKA